MAPPALARAGTLSFPEVKRGVDLLNTVLVLAAIGAVAYTDWRVESYISLGFLYFLPLALSALVNPLRVSLSLVVFCTLLHDGLSPFTHTGWEFYVRNLLTLIGYAGVVLVVNRLRRQREGLYETVAQQRDEMARDLALAAEVQKRMLPTHSTLRDGIEIAAHLEAVKFVGGDYYDYFELPRGELGVVIGDVSGKGTPAALLMAAVREAIRSRASDLSSPGEVLHAVNEHVYQMTDASQFVSLFYAKLSQGGDRFDYSNGGHCPPLLVRASGDSLPLDKGGLLLGVLPKACYESDGAALGPGDLLVFYTDGVIEATNAEGEEFGRRRLLELVQRERRRPAEEIVGALRGAVAEFRGNTAAEDDATVIVLRKLKSADSSPGA